MLFFALARVVVALNWISNTQSQVSDLEACIPSPVVYFELLTLFKEKSRVEFNSLLNSYRSTTNALYQIDSCFNFNSDKYGSPTFDFIDKEIVFYKSDSLLVSMFNLEQELWIKTNARLLELEELLSFIRKSANSTEFIVYNPSNAAVVATRTLYEASKDPSYSFTFEDASLIKTYSLKCFPPKNKDPTFCQELKRLLPGCPLLEISPIATAKKAPINIT